MKRIENDRTIELPPVRLYLDDIDHILGLLKKDMVTELQFNEYSYESMDELKSNIQRDSITKLTINASSNAHAFGYITINIKQDGVILYDSGETIEKRAFLSEVLRTKVRWYSWKPTKVWWYGICGGFCFLLPIVACIAVTLTFQQNIVALITLSVAIWAGFLTMIFSDRIWIGGSKIYLYTRFGKPTFWQRNRDTITISVITIIISAVIGYILGYLSKG